MGQRWTVNRRGVAATVSLLVPVWMLAACDGDERTVDGYCAEVAEQQDELSAKYNQRADDLEASDDGMLVLLGTLAMTLEAQGDLVAYMSALYEVAPDDIRPDVGVVRDAFQAQADATADGIDNPLGALAEIAVEGFQSAGALDRVSTYTEDDCGRNI